MTSHRRLLVSIHDVSPALEAPVRTLWELCQSLDITPALLVVPNWHGAWPLEQYPHFVAWLRACEQAGAEIILHGERHDEVGSPRRWADEARAFLRTKREGEFLTLTRDAAGERMARGLARLRSQQLSPVGFIPPAWLARDATHSAAHALGLHFSESETEIHVHRRVTRLRAPALRWSARTPLRATVSRIVAQWRWHAWRWDPLIRIALHPQDLSHPLTAASLRRELERWTARRCPVPYRAI